MRKPRKPTKPKAPTKFIDLEVKAGIYNDRVELTAKKIIEQFKLTFGCESWMNKEVFLKFLTENLDRVGLLIEDGYYGDDKDVYFAIQLKAEDKIASNINYESELKKFKDAAKKYPAQLEEYHKKLEAYELQEEKRKSRAQTKKIEEAKRLLREAGEL